MSVEPQHIDRAAWKRYSKRNADRCEICGHRAQVRVKLVATELGATGNAVVVSQEVLLCDSHGQHGYGDALRRLRGTEVLKT